MQAVVIHTKKVLVMLVITLSHRGGVPKKDLNDPDKNTRRILTR